MVARVAVSALDRAVRLFQRGEHGFHRDLDLGVGQCSVG